jgi:protein gp37
VVENSKIEWCDHTFNPWVGCTKVSPACDNCYAENWAKRTGQPDLWSGERRRTSEANWRKPIKWDDKARQEGQRYRVFCASLADVFDNQVPEEWRDDLWSLIRNTPSLDWLLLTKRPQNIRKMLPAITSEVPLPNVWFGTTVENQEEADRRISHLFTFSATKRFLSCEPLLGPINLSNVKIGNRYHNVLGGIPGYGAIDWVIAGGESGPRRRLMYLDWMESLQVQCAAAKVAYFAKQWDKVRKLPPDMTVREFPTATLQIA